MARARLLAGLVALVLLPGVPAEAGAATPAGDAPQEASTPDATPVLLPGAVEVGLSGSLLASGVAGRLSVISLRAALMRGAGAGLVGFGGEVSWRHVGDFGDLEVVRVTGDLSWQARLGASSAYPFLAAWIGADHERTGSFGRTRMPFGTGVGLRALVSRDAAIRVEYRYGRVHDPDAADFDEHEVLTGVTLLLRNDP